MTKKPVLSLRNIEYNLRLLSPRDVAPQCGFSFRIERGTRPTQRRLPYVGRTLTFEEFRDLSKLSNNWYENLRDRYFSTDTPASSPDLYPEPIVPWIAPRLNSEIFRLILRLGQTQKLSQGELLFARGYENEDLFVVCRGVTARGFGNLSQERISLSPPGRLAAGYLNFFSGRNAAEHCYALTDAEVCRCPKRLLNAVLDKDSALAKLCMIQFEYCHLSDRLDLACHSLLDAKDRLKAYLMSWAVVYGDLHREEGEERTWIRMLSPMPMRVQSLIVNASPNWVDRMIHVWRKEDLWRRDREWVLVAPELLQEAYVWVRTLSGIKPDLFPMELCRMLECLREQEANLRRQNSGQV